MRCIEFVRKIFARGINANICKYIDISGGLETSGIKDISKIDIFLNNIKQLNNETKKRYPINRST